MKLSSAMLLTGALLFGSLFGAGLGGGFIHSVIAMFLGVFVFIPAAAALAIGLIAGFRKNERPKAVSGFSVLCVACLLGVMAFTFAGTALLKYRENDVRFFVRETLPLLDGYQAQHGRYPARLEEVTERKIPYYFRVRRGGYTSDGKTFSFYYESPDQMISGLMLSNHHRTWVRAD